MLAILLLVRLPGPRRGVATRDPPGPLRGISQTPCQPRAGFGVFPELSGPSQRPLRLHCVWKKVGPADPGGLRMGNGWNRASASCRFPLLPARTLQARGLGNPRAHTLPPWGDGQAVASVLSSFSAAKILAGTTGWNNAAYTADPSGLSTGSFARVAVSFFPGAGEHPGQRRPSGLEVEAQEPEVDECGGRGEQAEREGPAHARAETPALEILRVHRRAAAGADREVVERDRERAEQAVHRREARAPLAPLAEGPQQQVGEIDEPEEQGHGEPRIPRPPVSPGPARPDRSARDVQRAEDDADFGGS